MTDDLAAYLDGSLPADRTAALEAHLARCDGCRAELVAARLVLSPRRIAGHGLLAGGLLAATLLIGLPLLLSKTRSEAVDQERATENAQLPRIAVTAPSDNASLPADGVMFAWRSAGAGAQYRVTVTDSVGSLIWSAERSDTTANIDAALLHRARRYFWFVDALLADGRTRTSGTRRFSTMP